MAIRPTARPAAPATVTAKAVTSPEFASIHWLKALMTAVTLTISPRRVEFIASAIAFIAPSTAESRRRNAPPSPASIFCAVSAATPSTSWSLTSIASSSSVFAVSVSPASDPRISKISSANASFSAVGIVLIALAMSRMISAILRRFPFASTVSTPTERS